LELLKYSWDIRTDRLGKLRQRKKGIDKYLP
jgi:hypothetical protein